MIKTKDENDEKNALKIRSLSLTFTLSLLLGSLAPLALPEHALGESLPSPRILAQAERWVEAERGRDYIVYRNELTGEHKQLIYPGPIHTWDGARWVSYVFENKGDYYQVRHPMASVRFYPDRAEFYDENLSEVRIENERWTVERWGNGKWEDVYLSDAAISYEIVDENEVHLIRTGRSSVGTVKQTYTFTKGSPVKIKVELAFRNGTVLAWDNNYIYALGGARYEDADRQAFFRYSISASSWTQLANTPGPQGAGNAMTWSGYDNYVYALLGSNSHGTIFARYDASSNTWQVRASPPAGIDDGASLVWAGGEYLYALRGEHFETTPLQDFWRYNITDDSWTPMTPIPENGGVGDGASLLWIGNWLPEHADHIYALGGGDCWENPSDNFYRYFISSNTWEKLTSVPFPTGYYVGNRLGFAAGNIYYWQGATSDLYGGGRKFCVFEFPV